MSRYSDVELVLPKLGLRGRATFYCQTPSGIIRPSSIRRQSNMIVDAGLNALASTVAFQLNAWVGVGTGNAEPAAGQTALITPINLGGLARTNTAHIGDNTSYFDGTLCVHKRALKFPAATADTTLREWAFFQNSTGAPMWNRELFRTPGGVAADYTVLTGEELVCELETYTTVPTGDTAASLVISGVTYDLVLRPLNTNQTIAWNPGSFGPNSLYDSNNGCQVDTSTGVLNAENGGAFGTGASSRTVAAYGTGNFYRDVTYTWEPANITASIQRMCWLGNGGASMKWQAKFTPVVPKTSSKRLALSFRTTWGRP